jgi:phosphohistidine phosphatase
MAFENGNRKECTMHLYLMQHGLAVSEQEDPEEPLSPAGVAQIKAVGRVLKRLDIHPELIACSPKKRSRQSAALIAEAVNYPYSDLLESEQVKAMTPPEETLELLRGQRQPGTALIAGHLPSLARIASLVLGHVCEVKVHFENGGLCRLDLPEEKDDPGELRFCLTAEQIKLIAG